MHSFDNLHFCNEFFIGPIDINGNPVERPKSKYPYTYSSFVTWRNGENEEITESVYTDRLLQWDWDKHNRLCREHFGNEGQYWDNRDPKKIEAFLRDWTDNQELQLIVIMECCNQATGYPLWYFGYNIPQQD